MTPVHWLRRHPLLGYFALAYGISWGGILIVLGVTGFNLVELRPVDTGLIFISMLLGPSVGAVAMTGLLEGRAGLRALGTSLARWHVGGRWYAFALLTLPFLLLAILWTLGTFVAPVFAPRFEWPLFAIGLVAGTFEEIGWTGFATPRLLARLPLFMAGLSLGLAWALWHVLVDFRQHFDTIGFAWLLEFAVFFVAALTAYRLLMTWMYASTKSLLLAVLMHASFTGWLVVLFPSASLEQGLLWQAALAACLWIVVAVVYLRSADRGPAAGLLHTAPGTLRHSHSMVAGGFDETS